MKRTLFFLGAFFLLQFIANAQWVQQSPGFTNPHATVIGLSVVDPLTAWAVAFDSSGTDFTREVARTINGSNTWAISDLGQNYLGHQVMDVHGLDANTAWVITLNPIFDNGAIFKTTDGGTTWTEQGANLFNNGTPLNVYFFDAQNGIVLGNEISGGFRIATTTNGGATWTVLPAASTPVALSGDRMEGHYASKGNHIWFGTEMGRIYHSADKGLTWSVTGGTGLISISSITFKDTQTGWALGFGGMVETTNGGQTWTGVQASGPMRLSYLTYVPNTPATLVSTGIFGTDRGSAFSTDGGRTWINLENTEAHTKVVFLNNHIGYSGGIKANGGGGMHTFLGFPNIFGISEKMAVQPLKTYPNPSSGVVNFKTGFSGKTHSVSVYNLLGQPVFELPKGTVIGAETQLDLRHLSAGVYLLKVVAGDQIYTNRLVLKK